MAKLSQSQVKRLLYSSLRELGLTEQETALYALSLAMGPASLAALSKGLGISRPNIYKLIQGLERKGLARFSERKRYARTFVVEPPTTVRELLRKKREALATYDQDIVGALPDLLAMYRQGGAATQVQVLEGRDQFLKLFYQILDEAKGTTEFLGSAKDFIGFISWAEERRWIAARVRKGIKINALLLASPDTATLKAKDTAELRETRVLRGVAPFVTGIQLFANKVVLWQPKTPIAIVITDEYIVGMLRALFNSFWQQS